MRYPVLVPAICKVICRLSAKFAHPVMSLSVGTVVNAGASYGEIDACFVRESGKRFERLADTDARAGQVWLLSIALCSYNRCVHNLRL